LAGPTWTCESLASGSDNNQPLITLAKELKVVFVKRAGSKIGYGKPMNSEDMAHFQDQQENSTSSSEFSSQSSSIDAIRDRISSLQDKEIDLHVAEYDAIHGQLERALSAIDGL
jgi:hypothetical protein